MKTIAISLAIATTLAAQSFEVASIKPAAPPEPSQGIWMGMSGGPGEKDPELYKCHNCTIPMLINRAYDVKRFQLTFPSWMNAEKFDISARVPAGATKGQFKVMLQNLLTERFKLVFHRDQKEMQIFEMVVAKGGPKLKEWVPDPPKEGDAAEETSGPGLLGGRRGPNLDKEGFPIIPRGCKGCMMVSNDKARMTAEEATMADFADRLSNQLGKPVHDATGLKGKYDIDLTWGMTMTPRAPEDANSPLGSEPRPDFNQMMMSSIQSQLGLKLEAKKGMVETIVVDRAEKVPTEN
jgi:uncharacterized protein (TIGR03435 family)